MRLLLGQAEAGWLESWLLRLFDTGPVGPLAALAFLGASVVIGSLHALAPGHGKGVVAAYLVGERGRPRDAVALGLVVSFMHTASVLVVALVLVGLTRAGARAGALPELANIGGGLRVAAGVLVLAVGSIMLIRQLRRRRHGRRLKVPADHGHADHGHADHHAHADHRHLLPAARDEGASPLSRSGLVLLGMSGGLLPSPSAFLVLTTGLFTGRAGFALLLVLAFSVGLAATLTAVGLAVLWGRDRLVDRLTPGGRLSRLTRAIPIASAVLLCLVGAGVAVLGVLRL